MESILGINIISFENNNIIVILDDKGEPWFKAKDVVTVLEYRKIEEAIIRMVDKDDKKTLIDLRRTRPFSIYPLMDNEKDSIFINELGIYSLILNSKKNEKIKFKKWIENKIILYIKKYRKYELKQSLKLKRKKQEDYKEILENVFTINNSLDNLKLIDEVKNEVNVMKTQVIQMLDSYIQTNRYILCRRLI